jgi:NADH dehydrogenase (ubiquinone) 1 beta subcomplex subunit 3
MGHWGGGLTPTSNRIMPNMPLFRDPWAKAEAWRRHPVFSSRAMFRNLFPGFGIAVVAFTGYVMFDNMYSELRAVQAHKGSH